MGHGQFHSGVNGLIMILFNTANAQCSLFVAFLDKPENFQFTASERQVCQLGEVISFTCSADGNPAVQTYQLFENDILVTDGSNNLGMWNRTMTIVGVFIYKCVANNTAGAGQSETVTVAVNGESDNCYMHLKLDLANKVLFLYDVQAFLTQQISKRSYSYRISMKFKLGSKL